MTFNITTADVGILTRAGRVPENGEIRVAFTGAKVSEIEVNGKRFSADPSGAFVIRTSDLRDKNSATAIVPEADGTEEREIILEEFGYNSRERCLKPLWNREIVAGFHTIGLLIEKVDRLKKRIRRLEQMIEPAENDLCI